MAFRFLEDVTLADVAFEATGKTLSELFTSAAEAVIETMANPKSIKPKLTKKITKKEETIDKLLFELLEEIIYLKDKDNIVFCDVTCTVDEKKMSVKAVLHGDAIKPQEQELHQDVKAVTLHYYTVEKNDKGWRTQVVLDI